MKSAFSKVRPLFPPGLCIWGPILLETISTMRSTSDSTCNTGNVTLVPDALDCDEDMDGLDGTTESTDVVAGGGRREIYSMDFDGLPIGKVSGKNCSCELLGCLP